MPLLLNALENALEHDGTVLLISYGEGGYIASLVDGPVNVEAMEIGYEAGGPTLMESLYELNEDLAK